MGHRLVEDSLRESEERAAEERMGAIGQNGNEGEHYADVTSESYKLDVDNIHDLEDVKDIFEAMGLSFNVIGELSDLQKRLVNSNLFVRR